MALLKDRDFLLLFAGQSVSRFGDGMFTAATAWLAWSLTHDPAAVALVTVAAYAPSFLVTFVAASYADRYDRRRLMIVTDLVRAVLVALAVGLLASGLMNLTVLVAATALLALVGAPFAPARNAIVPQIVPAGLLQQANGLLQVAFRAAFFVGPLVLAPILAVSSLTAALALDGLTFLISASAVAALRLRRPARHGRQSGLRSDLVAGLAALRSEPEVLLVIVTFVVALALASGFLTVGLVSLVGQGGQYGLLLGTAGLAEVAGALLLARIAIRRLALAAVLAWALLGVFRLPLGLATSPIVAAALLAMTGLASALTDIPLIALVQQRIPDDHLAKALGLWEAGIAGALAVSPFIASTTISMFGVKAAFMLSGAALIALAGVAAAVLRLSNRRRLLLRHQMIDQGDQDVAADRPPAQVAHQDRDVRVEVERVTDLGNGAFLPAVEAVDADHEGDAAVLEEVDGRETALQSPGVRQNDRAERAVDQVVPHEPEAFLARCAEEVHHQVGADGDPAEVHRDGCRVLGRHPSDVVDADSGHGQVFLRAQRRDLADRADHRGLAHAEAARDQDLHRHRRGTAAGRVAPVRVVVGHLAPPEGLSCPVSGRPRPPAAGGPTPRPT